MNVDAINQHLLQGNLDVRDLLPNFDQLRRSDVQFRFDFGLDDLPREPGIILIRGARQFGKSTWLESQVHATVSTFGPGSALYLNGDELAETKDLIEAARHVVTMFSPKTKVRRLFIDEVTSVPEWERALKRLFDGGEIRDVLVVTTGSRATDLRRGTERLPGRKGQLERTDFWFTPVPFAEFQRVANGSLGDELLDTYLLTGGCPAACAAMLRSRELPEHLPTMMRDWILGEVAMAGRDRSALLAVMETLMARGGTPIGQNLLAREAGLANNSVAAGFLGILADLMCVGVQDVWDPQRRTRSRRHPAKYPPINLLAAVAWDRERMRTVAAFRSQPPAVQGKWYEWLVAQEVWRRAARAGTERPENLRYWQSKEREVDFVVGERHYLEVKRGRTAPLEFSWFPKTIPHADLWVVGQDRFEAGRLRGLTLEDLLLEANWPRA